MMTTELFGVLSLIITMIQYIPYCWKTYKGLLRPHVFSYVIWGVGAAIVAAAQWAAGAGPGAWAMSLVAVLCFCVVGLSLRGGTTYLTKSDIWTFIIAMSAIPIWYFTKDPLYAVIIITAIDIAAFYMIIKKARLHPSEDSITFYLIAISQYTMSLFATDVINVTTVLNPAVLIVSALIVVWFLIAANRKANGPAG